MVISPAHIAARRDLGMRLRQFRDAAGMSGQAVAAALGWSQAKISGIERAKTMTTVADVQALLAVLGVPDNERPELIELAEAAVGEPGDWRNSSRSGLTRRQQDYIGLYNVATRIRHYQPGLIPGYLQTPDYAREVITIAGASDVERALEFRLARRAALTLPDAPEYQIVMLETALRWCIGGAAVMQEQLRLVAELAELPNVSVRVVPFNQVQRTYVQHPLVLFDFPYGTPPEAMIETTTQDIRVHESGPLAKLDHYFTQLSLSALSRADSMIFIQSIARSYAD